MSVKVTADKKFRRAKAVKPVRKKGGSRSSWRAVSVAAAGLLGLYTAYRAFDLVLHASALQVRKIAVHGNVWLSDGDVTALMEGLAGANIITADLPHYRARLLESPWVADVALRRILPSTIQVFVSERRPIGLCRLGTQMYLIDRTGTLIDEFGPQYVSFDLPIITGAVRLPSSGEPAIDERRVALGARVIDELAARKDLGSRVSEIDVSYLHDVVLLLADDPALLHVGDEKFVERLHSYVQLASTLRQRVPAIDYVDLRFDDRIYVRPTGSAVVQVTSRRPERN